ncbi:MAG TPA: hypothetical protein PKH07_08515 [bacterium]|nr:hypothetical protein [bacterium]
MKQFGHFLLLISTIVSFSSCSAFQKGGESMREIGNFFEHVDTGVSLPEDAVYPKGRIFPYMGYSGIHVEDATNGFTVAGHHYGSLTLQKEKLHLAKVAGLSYIFGVGLDGTFVKEPPLTYTPQLLRDTVRQQVLEVVNDPFVLWWYVRPEELRMWRPEEDEYLRIATETIRQNDPHDRPIWMYDPNHRNAESLMKTGRYLDIIGKGCYANAAGHQDSRIWIRWSIDQETTACRELEKLDGRPRTPLVMPQMSKDPDDPALDGMIPTWARHDVYLGLMAGAKGVCIFSLFPRAAITRTHKIHYEAFSRIGKELTGELNLGKVFLFGEERSDLVIQQTEGPATVELYTGPKNKLEENTTSQEERQRHLTTYPALMSKEISYAGSRYLFSCNSTQEQIVCEVSGIPQEGVIIEKVFDGKRVDAPDGSLTLTFDPWQARCIRISRAE